jgi:uncharacterized membrane protein YuzA (DUF378 family)
MDNRMIGLIAWWLVIVGGINWGLIGLADLNLVGIILPVTFLARLVYILVGLGAAYLIYEKYFLKKVL